MGKQNKRALGIAFLCTLVIATASRAQTTAPSGEIERDLAALSSPGSHLQDLALLQLIDMGPDAASAVPLAIEPIKRRYNWKQSLAGLMLATGAAGEAAVRQAIADHVLTQADGNEIAAIAKSVVNLDANLRAGKMDRSQLAQLQGFGMAAVPLMFRDLQSDDLKTRLGAIFVLREIDLPPREFHAAFSQFGRGNNSSDGDLTRMASMQTDPSAIDEANAVMLNAIKSNDRTREPLAVDFFIGHVTNSTEVVEALIANASRQTERNLLVRTLNAIEQARCDWPRIAGFYAEHWGESAYGTSLATSFTVFCETMATPDSGETRQAAADKMTSTLLPLLGDPRVPDAMKHIAVMAICSHTPDAFNAFVYFVRDSAKFPTDARADTEIMRCVQSHDAGVRAEILRIFASGTTSEQSALEKVMIRASSRPETAPAILALLNDANPLVRLAGLRIALTPEYGQPGPLAKTAVLAALNDPSPAVQMEGLGAAVTFKNDAKVYSLLVKTVGSANPALRNGALSALVALVDSDNSKTLLAVAPNFQSQLQPLLSSSDPTSRQQAGHLWMLLHFPNLFMQKVVTALIVIDVFMTLVACFGIWRSGGLPNANSIRPTPAILPSLRRADKISQITGGFIMALGLSIPLELLVEIQSRPNASWNGDMTPLLAAVFLLLLGLGINRWGRAVAIHQRHALDLTVFLVITTSSCLVSLITVTLTAIDLYHAWRFQGLLRMGVIMQIAELASQGVMACLLIWSLALTIRSAPEQSTSTAGVPL